MSVTVMARVWADADCAGSDLLVLLAIADNARDDGYAWPGLKYLAVKTRLARSSVQECLHRLREKGLLELEEQGGGHRSNGYRVLTGIPESGTPPLPAAGTQATGQTGTQGPESTLDPAQPSLNHHEPSAPGRPSSARPGCNLHPYDPRPGCPTCITLTDRPRPASDQTRTRVLTEMRGRLKATG